MSVLVFSPTQIKSIVRNDVLPQNEIIINSEADFPLQDATTITLEDGITYKIGNIVTTSKRFVCVGSSGITAGNSTKTYLTYTGTNPMFTVTNSRIRMEHIRIDCPNAIVFSLTGTNTGNVNERINVASSVFDNCVGVLDFVNAGAFVFSECQVQNNTGPFAIRIAGTNIGIQSIERMFIDGMPASSKTIDFTTSTTNEIEFDNLTAIGDSSAYALSGLANNGNLTTNGFASIENCNFSSFTTPLQNITEDDTKWMFEKNSSNVKRSVFIADSYLNVQTDITPIVQNQWYLINSNNWLSDVAKRFTTNNDGEITYIGEDPITVLVVGSVSLTRITGSVDELEARLAKNNNTPNQKTGGTTKNSTATSVPVNGIFSLVKNDKIGMYVRNIEGTTGIRVKRANLSIIVAS